MKKSETPKYILITDHFASHNANDRIILLDAKTIESAMEESNRIINLDEELYLAALYQKTSKRDSNKPGAVNYKRILVNRTHGWNTLEHENKMDVYFYYKSVDTGKKTVPLLYCDIEFV